MEFGEWVRNNRDQRHLDIRAFAALCDTDASTISRIETQKTEATLFTAYKIGRGIGVSIDQILVDLGMSLTPPKMRFDYRLLKISHLEKFLRFAARNRLEAYELLAYLLTLVTDAYIDPQNERISFVGTEINKMLRGEDLYSFRIAYPPLLSISLIHICYFDGLISRTDIGKYLANIESGHPFDSSISRSITTNKTLLRENFERIKLLHILENAAKLSSDGTLVKMFWGAIEFELVVKRFHEMEKGWDNSIKAAKEIDEMIDMLITIYRWVDYLKIPVDNWLINLE